jgi:hypothetical protein
MRRKLSISVQELFERDENSELRYIKDLIKLSFWFELSSGRSLEGSSWALPLHGAGSLANLLGS